MALPLIAIIGRPNVGKSTLVNRLCKSREAIAIQRLATDPHSPSEFRCNQIAKNFDVFHDTYATKPGDAMFLEPEQRVSIW